mmetsp:Transcript_16222/g.25100  ORF Transcript_16222/g.25100 Transcript_16222/m.25100 type:complete len:100 (-) Transcript_16222:632-931(-)
MNQVQEKISPKKKPLPPKKTIDFKVDLTDENQIVSTLNDIVKPKIQESAYNSRKKSKTQFNLGRPNSLFKTPLKSRAIPSDMRGPSDLQGGNDHSFHTA